MTVHTEWKTFKGKKGNSLAFIATMEPVSEPRPTVLVIQEIWGVNSHIQDVTKRLAAAGYVAIAPDLFAKDGVRPDSLSEQRIDNAKAFLHSIPHTAWFNAEEREKEILKQPTEKQEDLKATLTELFGLLGQPGAFVEILTDAADFARNTFEKTKNMPVTSIGFCLGGALSAAIATLDPKHAGSIIFYGRPPQKGIEDIQCPVLGFYGGEDPNITNLIPSFEEEMKKHEKNFEAIIYPEAKHAFFNDTNPTYHVQFARDAFAKSLQFLNEVTK